MWDVARDRAHRSVPAEPFLGDQPAEGVADRDRRCPWVVGDRTVVRAHAVHAEVGDRLEVGTRLLNVVALSGPIGCDGRETRREPFIRPVPARHVA